MNKQHSSGLFHRFYHDAEFGCHRGVGLLQGVEIQDDIQDFVCNMESGANQNGKGIQSGINKDRIAMAVSWREQLS
jgi:hypothetical protein